MELQHRYDVHGEHFPGNFIAEYLQNTVLLVAILGFMVLLDMLEL